MEQIQRQLRARDAAHDDKDRQLAQRWADHDALHEAQLAEAQQALDQSAADYALLENERDAAARDRDSLRERLAEADRDRGALRGRRAGGY